MLRMPTTGLLPRLGRNHDRHIEGTACHHHHAIRPDDRVVHDHIYRSCESCSCDDYRRNANAEEVKHLIGPEADFQPDVHYRNAP